MTTTTPDAVTVTTAPTVLVADDHPLWLSALERDLTERGLTVVATATDGPSTVRRARATRPDVHDHDLLSVAAHPHRLTDQPVRHRVLAVLEVDHRGVVGDRAGHPERGGERCRGQRVQPVPFLEQQLGRHPAGDPVRPGVDLGAERRARLLQLGERGVLGVQVRLGGHHIGLGDAHRRLAAALGLRIRRHTRADAHPVVAADRHDRGTRHNPHV